MDDKKIIQLLWQRAESAIEALAKKFGNRLMSIAMNILGVHRDAEESVNDTYLAVWNTIPPKKPDSLAAEGVKAASYIEFPGATSPEPPDEIIDFILDRPFIFAITTDSIPLFIGTVNNP